MKTYTNQYYLLFSLSWAVMYLIHPSWTLPIPVTGRAFLYFGLIIYFAALAHIIDRWGSTLYLDKPAIVFPKDLLKHIKDNIWLSIICFIAVLLHIIPISSPIYLVGDEALFIQNGLWIYDYFGGFWHKAAKYVFWVAIVLSVIIARKKYVSGPDAGALNHKTKSFLTRVFVFSGLCFLVIYFILIRDLPFYLTMIRYPPLQKFLYLFSYFMLGINHIGPRLWQLMFYILSAVYLYRTINLFSNKDTALLGASIYLFSPLIFVHAHFAETASGLIFFVILISYYFLRFLTYQDNRALLLSSYFIGTGFLYKRDILLMFFICSAYLVFQKIRDRKMQLMMPLKILSLSLFPIIPWMIIGKYFNWRNAWISLSPFTSLEKVSEYLLSIPEQISWIVFILFVLSFLYVLLTKKSNLSYYWGFVFISFYVFYTSQNIPKISQRFSMVFYPTIAVFLALFFSGIVRNIRWKYTYKVVYAVLTVYLISLCMAPYFNSQLVAYKNVKEQYFPNKKAMEWVKNNIKDGEKLLSLRFKADLFYRDKFGINEENIVSFWYNLEEVSTPPKLRAFCKKNKISYILVPHGPNFFQVPGAYNEEILGFLRNNKDNEFIEAAKFNLNENYIYILKLRDKD